MKERTSIGLDDNSFATFAALCEIEARGRKDELLYLVALRRKQLNISDKDFEKMVQGQLKLLHEGRSLEREATPN